MSRAKHSNYIPTDLYFEIFSRLPSKSIARSRCVSKLWESMLSSPSFTELFLTRSSTRPRLLFAIKRSREWRFFSSPQYPYDNEKSSLQVAATDYNVKLSGRSLYKSTCMCSFTSGLLCFPNVPILGGRYTECVICNPTTRQHVILPILKTGMKSKLFLGFDPIGKRYKVLLLVEDWGSHSTNSYSDYSETVHYIMTLGTRKMSWRKIPYHSEVVLYPLNKGICINGVLYYSGRQHETMTFVIVCFDVRSETFKFVDASCFNKRPDITLVNYKGKLGVIYWMSDDLCVWILEDVEKPEWSKFVYSFAGRLDSKFCYVIGMTSRGEIVCSGEDKFDEPVRFLYFDPERDTVKIVHIQGLKYRSMVYTFVDHVEDLNVNDVKPITSRMQWLDIISEKAI
ncbi:hypothetical protein CARUB_v10028190mg [Capsella rubella]|uniref:F-box domain-containing protein n=1 Tax=Capsella rubella TaxID=81985 RepID=R0ETP3_9BRAS|nr:F-box protein At3g57590 [Capsella rubella]EOA12427.1 hypothetical protein CARUB_v10028190mg [Capsella rubella]